MIIDINPWLVTAIWLTAFIAVTGLMVLGLVIDKDWLIYISMGYLTLNAFILVGWIFVETWRKALA